MTSTMTRDEAQALRAAHDTDAKLLSRKPKYELVAILRSETGAQGIYSKDEAVASILAARGFGIERLNEAIHVLHHEPGEVGSTACGLCVCQVTWTDGNGFLQQCELAPGHDGMHNNGQTFYAATP